MKRIIISPVILAGMLVAAVMPKLQAEDNAACSNATLQGAYGFYSTGTIIPAGTPRVLLGREVYDGKGNFFNDLYINDDGILSHSTNSGTYTVNPDCRGTISTTLGNLKLDLDFVIVNGGKEVYFAISSNPASLVVYGVRKKIQSDDHAVCSNFSLNGTYGFYSSGYVFPNETPRVLLGRETYDGKGNFSNSLTINNDGTEIDTTGSGTYMVNADCTGTIFATLGNLNTSIH